MGFRREVILKTACGATRVVPYEHLYVPYHVRIHTTQRMDLQGSQEIAVRGAIRVFEHLGEFDLRSGLPIFQEIVEPPKVQTIMVKTDDGLRDEYLKLKKELEATKAALEHATRPMPSRNDTVLDIAARLKKG